MLWPFATKCAQDRMTNLHVDLNIETPDMRFSNTKAVNVQLKHYHTFGCPVYILDSRLQINPKGVPKWEPQSSLGIYVGHSPAHAGSVALVLNPRTGLVSPQYHVVYEDQFITVHHMRDLKVPPNWAQLVQNSSELVTTEQYDLTKTWFEGQDDPIADTTLQSLDNDALLNLKVTINRSKSETFLSKGATVTSTNTTSSEGVNINPNEVVMDPNYEGGTVSADDPEVTWDSVIDEAIPATSKVSEGGDTLCMSGIINLQEYGLRISPRIAAQRAKLRRSVLTTLFCLEHCSLVQNLQ